MISKPGPVLHSYQVNTTTETSEEGKSREERKNKKDKNAQPPHSDKEAPKPVEAVVNPDGDLASRQLIDSEKVLELLAHAPSTMPVGNPFSKGKNLPHNSERKKLNRNL